MGPIAIFKVYRSYGKIQDILKEKVPMNSKLWQIIHVLITLAGVVGVPSFDEKWLHKPEHAIIFSVLVAISTILHFLAPSVFGAPTKQAQDSSDPMVRITGKSVVILLALLLIPAAYAQSLPSAPTPTPTSGIQNLYFGGISYNAGASPAIAGTGGYAHALNQDGTYGFAIFDALPNTLRPFTVSTNVGAGVAQKVLTVEGIPVYTPVTAGFSWTGHNSGWQWSGGAAASVHIKGPWYFLPNVRFIKSSVTGGTGYQVIGGAWIGFGK